MPRLYFIIISLVFISLALSLSWPDFSFDSAYYHFAHIRWNEEYAVVPGLGNLEERLSFNSSYFLLSAVFSLRFIFGDAILCVQTFFYGLIICWSIKEFISSRFELIRLLPLLLLLLYFLFSSQEILQTSTDAIPSLVIFYLLVKAILYPSFINKNIIIYTMLPFALITIKLSCVFFLLLPMVLLLSILVKKDYKTAIFIMICIVLLMVPWLVRSVYLSGYLLYPFYQIDPFSFDWKIPIDIVITESNHVHNDARFTVLGRSIKAFMAFSVGNIQSWVLILYFVCLLSVCGSSYLLVRYKKMIEKVYYYIFSLILINLAFFAYEAPTLRFAFGFILVSLFFFSYLYAKCFDLLGTHITNYLVIRSSKTFKYTRYKTNVLILFFISILLTLASFNRSNNYRYYLSGVEHYNKLDAWLVFIWKPHSLIRQLTKTDNEAKEEFFNVTFTPYNINDHIIIYISEHPKGFVYDKIPAVADCQREGQSSVFQDYRNVETRGTTLQEGFRSKLNNKDSCVNN